MGSTSLGGAFFYSQMVDLFLCAAAHLHFLPRYLPVSDSYLPGIGYPKPGADCSQFPSGPIYFSRIPLPSSLPDCIWNTTLPSLFHFFRYGCHACACALSSLPVRMIFPSMVTTPSIFPATAFVQRKKHHGTEPDRSFGTPG